MKRVNLPERPGWRAEAERLGFTFADMYGEPYWDETSAYEFSLAQIEGDIEDPCTELHQMCRVAVDAIVKSEALMARMGLPPAHWDMIAESWQAGETELYGRFDLSYDGKGPAKVLEYNADTPTALYESASFQWLWLEQMIESGFLSKGSDQFNGIHEALVARFADIFEPATDVHFAAMKDNPEDYATVEAMAWAAREAGLGAHYTDLDQIAVSTEGQFLDSEDRVIGALFKLYPWEDLMRDPFADRVSASGCRFLEPPWKALVSNKAILSVLWQLFEGHPNLLPAFFHEDVVAALAGRRIDDGLFSRSQDMLSDGYVIKPLFSREGGSVDIVEGGVKTEAATNRDYDAHPKIVQAYHPLPVFDDMRPVIGAWVVGRTCVGMGLREDKARITQDLSRFKPHYIKA